MGLSLLFDQAQAGAVAHRVMRKGFLRIQIDAATASAAAALFSHCPPQTGDHPCRIRVRAAARRVRHAIQAVKSVPCI